MVLDQTIFVCFCVYVLKMRCRTLSRLGKHSITSVLHALAVRGGLCIFRPTLSPLTPLISLTNRSNNQVIFKQRLTGLRALWSTWDLPINKGCLQGFQYSIGIFWCLLLSVGVGCVCWGRGRDSPCNSGCIKTYYVIKDGLDPWYSRVLKLHMSAATSCFFLLPLKTISIIFIYF